MADFNTHEQEARPICPHSEFCGGCIYQGVAYEDQLADKEKQVYGFLEAKSVVPAKVDAIEGCTVRYGYRNKMEYTFGDFVKDGETTLGMHRKKNFMSIITVDECQLVDEDFNVILDAVLNFVKTNEYPFYHKRTHKGLMRNLIIRKGMRTEELLINIVTTSEEGFDEEAFTEMLLALNLRNKIVGILRTFNDNIADAVNCERLKTLWGRDYYMEKILNLDFKVVIRTKNKFNTAMF